jgi:hypothetical protein
MHKLKLLVTAAITAAESVRTPAYKGRLAMQKSAGT